MCNHDEVNGKSKTKYHWSNYNSLRDAIGITTVRFLCEKNASCSNHTAIIIITTKCRYLQYALVGYSAHDHFICL